MNVFRFINQNSSTKMEQAELINGLTSKMWIERYLTAGEFTFIAPSDSGMRELLPIGSFISHVNSTEIMIVENHEITDDSKGKSEIKITGRGFETFLENRVVGSNKLFPISNTVSDYILPIGYTWDQAVALIADHILVPSLLDSNNEFPYVSVMTTASGSGISIIRTTARNTLYNVLLSLLAIDNLGIKVVRPGPWSPYTPINANTVIVIHSGVNRTKEVIFSYATGEIVSADYLWSNKKLKNAALITGKWVETVLNPSEIKYDRRMMYVNASDIDQNYSVAPTGDELNAVISAMQQRGVEALASQNAVALTKAEVTQGAVKSIYRTDFDVGDLITVSGDYNEVSTMRITEYVEIEDATGERGYPTLAID